MKNTSMQLVRTEVADSAIRGEVRAKVGLVPDGKISFGDVSQRRLVGLGDNSQEHPARGINRTRTYTVNFINITEYYKIVHI